SALIVGTELRQWQDAPQWPALLAAVQTADYRPIGYVADGLEQAERFGYWDRFDFVGTSLYPALAAAPEQRRAQMRAAAARVQALGERSGRPVWVAELGLRSAHGSLAA
ncbi:glycoside hydrolase family 113, partial [Pantoea dispersa]